MIVEEYHEMISFRLSKWLEKYNSFITQKETNSDWFSKHLNTNAAYHVKAILKKRNRSKVENIFKKIWQNGQKAVNVNL